MADGASDRALVPILTWLMRRYCGSLPIQGEYANLRYLQNPPRGLAERIKLSVELYPCDLLFVHRDAERATIERRQSEITTALGTMPLPAVRVVPVRMQEAWLLIDEAALRHAAGNPNGKVPLNLPDVRRLERLPNPKGVLHDLMRQASDLPARRNPRLNGFDVADRIQDFSPLYQLAAFRRLVAEVEEVVAANGWG